ncbi:MAG: hypothetical protein JNM84_06280 [Planctomycetes bacterium]|nr:hypothetical protein [Planctomycetota bacterium]
MRSIASRELGSRLRQHLFLFCGIASCAARAPAQVPSTWYVAQNGSPSGPGTTWATAFDTLDAALAQAAASSGTDVIRIGRGTFAPNTLTIPGNPRSATFLVPSGTTIQGSWNAITNTPPPVGFATGTVLSGSLGAAGRAHHVVTIPAFSDPLDPGVIIANLVVTGGNANDSASGNVHGGGIYSLADSLLLDTVNVDQNSASDRGAGLYAVGVTSNAKYCRFTDNVAGGAGGGAYTRTRFLVYNSTFLRNEASFGGGLYADRSLLPTGGRIVAGCRFKLNEASNSGGAIAFDGLGTPSGGTNFIVSACTLSQNGAGVESGGLHALASASTQRWILTSILWDNTAPANPELPSGICADYCIIEMPGGSTNRYPGCVADTNLNLDPLLATNQSLSSTSSPAYDYANPLFLAPDLLDVDGDMNTTEVLPLDIARNPRVSASGFLDIGAYEL